MARRSTSPATTPGLTLTAVATLLTELGFRAQTVGWGEGRTALLSATGGVSFNVVGGTNGQSDALSDVAFVASFQMPQPNAGLPEDWNRQRRFARTYFRDGLLVLEMDLLLPAIAPLAHLRTGIEVWSRLINELVATLQTRVAGEKN